MLFKTKTCSYLGRGAKNEENRGILLSWTFKVGENKALLLFSFFAPTLRYGYILVKTSYSLEKWLSRAKWAQVGQTGPNGAKQGQTGQNGAKRGEMGPNGIKRGQTGLIFCMQVYFFEENLMFHASLASKLPHSAEILSYHIMGNDIFRCIHISFL